MEVAWSFIFFLLASTSTTFVFLCVVSQPVEQREAQALAAIKAAFTNSANELLNWDTVSFDYCSWRGVLCDNLTSSVVSLLVSRSNLNLELGFCFACLI